ncbi:hypothetical protein B0J13DRAFT_674613 [Dactylonectria estremocensis]|uniref:C2 domain-containing protein n=1 Tax=Dactylonectria estremocensis TaxID=1079267 RepID=A0A9P9EZL3_9HYPO|nr:hypothetical protein B0J13DRAFT_674613 [Dactylonectria estremocensis]
MATKAKSHPLNAAHTAGIFADLSIDGPVVGTLVAIVDRAKNLPNRKTIGKQDPYCAARLGKEAKKTTTDVRGGQTPKWDQELRFTVHDSPDYYQLKISIFTDDKKTDLIGETWIDLRSIIIPGGGQKDDWWGLMCRGKFAGEIRIEITYYDSRPKPEKPAAVKPKQSASAESEYGSVKQRTLVKRRPLPIDPVTGEAPPTPAAAPAPPAPEQSTPPPRAHAKQPSHGGFVASQSPLQAVEYNTPPSHRARHPDHHSPSPHAGLPQEYVTPTRNEAPREAPRGARRSMNLSYEVSPRHSEDRDFSPKYPVQQQELMDHRAQFVPPPDAYETPMDDLRQFPSLEDDRPPPPPAHRTRHNSGGQELVPRNTYDASPPKLSHPMRHDVLRSEAHRHSMPSYPGRPTFKAYDSAPASTSIVPQNYDSSPRHSSYDANYDPHYRSMQPTVEDAPEMPNAYPNNYRQSRIQQQDELFDEIPNPAPLSLSRSPGGSPFRDEYSPSQQAHGYQDQNSYQDQNPYQMVPVSQSHPRDYSRSPGHEQNYQMVAVSPSQGRDYSRSPGVENPYQMVAVSPSHGREYSRSPADEQNQYQMVPHSSFRGREISKSPGQISYNSQSSQSQHSGHRMELETRHIQSSSSHGMPGMPASLVPGLDPSLSQEVTERIYEDRRGDRRQHSQSVSTPSRGRARTESYQGYGDSPDPSQSYALQKYDRRAIAYHNDPEPPATRSRGISPDPRTSPDPRGTSPNPQHTIRRKSVSPIPPPVEARRLSGVPFGPDSYDELNPSLVSSRDGTSPAPDFLKSEPKKIITYDGREIDPSDHLPMESWAPEPDKKDVPETRSRPALSGAQPHPPSARRVPRSGRHSMSATLPYGTPDEPRTPPAPASAGRTRLQKRNPGSAGPSPAAVSPLAPISPDNYQHRQSPYTPTRGLPRASTWDHQNENRAPQYGNGPPIPAKVPLPLMSGAIGSSTELALMEEMQSIDIGTGRSRRRGGY